MLIAALTSCPPPQMHIYKVCNTGHEGLSLSLYVPPSLSLPLPLTFILPLSVFSSQNSFCRLMVTLMMVNVAVAKFKVQESIKHVLMPPVCVYGITCTLLTLLLSHRKSANMLFLNYITVYSLASSGKNHFGQKDKYIEHRVDTETKATLLRRRSGSAQSYSVS